MAISWDGASWVAATPYGLRARVVNGNNVYLCITAGISAAGPATGPSGTSSNITDGTVHWSYLGAYTGSVLDVAPELGLGAQTIAAGAQGVFLALAEQLVADPAVWGDLLDDGRRYLAAHFGQLSRLRGKGPLAVEKVGPLQRAYASLTGEYAIELTPAGRAYMDLVHTTPAIFGFTG